MRINLQPKYTLTIACIAAFVTVSIAWSGDPVQTPKQVYQDTVPAKPKSKVSDKQYKKDFDKEISQLDKAMKELDHMPEINFEKIKAEIDQAMKQVQLDMAKHKIDMEKLQQELNETFSRANKEKMNEELRQAMKELDKLDVAKMKAEMQQSLKDLDKIDLEKMKKELARAMEEVNHKVNIEQIQKEIEMSMRKVDMDKVRKEMEMAREELEKNKENMKVDLSKAKEEIAKTKIDLQNYKALVERLEADGLINTNEDYKIEYKDGELFINGKRQPENVTDKYKKYFRKNTTIRKHQGEMNINIQ